MSTFHVAPVWATNREMESWLLRWEIRRTTNGAAWGRFDSERKARVVCSHLNRAAEHQEIR